MSRSEVRRFDAWAINELGIPGAVLMENAGRSCAELIIDKLTGIGNPKVCIFCGTGNNGGDGYVIARHLANAAIEPCVVICGDKSRVKGDALANLKIIEGMNLPISRINMADEPIAEHVRAIADGCNVLVDALFGTGLTGQLRADYRKLIHSINAQKLPVISVDIPSGLDCDTALPLGEAIKAAATVTFVAVKKGFAANASAAAHTGTVYIASIGVEPTAGPGQ
ncbi:MAG: NAD(P)H-hydrate epimerase [Planctomycetota bacterium]